MDRFKQCLFGFKIIYLLYLLLAFNAFVNGMLWMNLATYVITVLGGIMSIWVLLRWRRYRRTVCIVPLGMFVLSYIISAIIHISYAGAAENVKGLIWLVLPMILIYTTVFDMNREEIQQEMKWIFGVYITYCTIVNMLSLSMLFWGRKYDFQDAVGTIHPIGYRWGRLWGIYDDPNHGAVISVIAVFMLFYLFGKTKKLWHKILFVICASVQYAYIVFSDSRTGEACLVAGIVLYAFLQILSKLQSVERKQTVKKNIVFLVIAVCFIFAGDAALKAAYAPIDIKLKKIEAQKHLTTSKPGKANERKKNLEQDYSNGRIELWKNGLEIVETSPVIGIGYRNINAYARKNLPNLYMTKNASGVQYDSMHNLEMDVLVSQGIIGFGLFLFILAQMLWIIIRKVVGSSETDITDEILMLAMAMALGVAGTFLSFIFYVNSPQTFCFWLFLGYGMNLLTEKNEGSTR